MGRGFLFTLILFTRIFVGSTRESTLQNFGDPTEYGIYWSWNCYYRHLTFILFHMT